MVVQSAAPAPIERGLASIGAPMTGPSSILVVDSDPKVLRLLEAALRLRGWEVDTAETGRAAEQRAIRVPPTVVITEWRLADMDGPELVLRLRASGSSPALLILSNRSESASQIAAIGLGAETFLRKPFSMDELIRKVALLVDGRTLPANPGRALEGPLGSFSFGDLLAHLAQGLWSGTLTVEPSGGPSGATLHVRDGRIVEASWALLRGVPAVLQLCTRVSGTYTLAEATDANPNVFDGTVRLLSEALRLMEAGHLRRIQPDHAQAATAFAMLLTEVAPNLRSGPIRLAPAAPQAPAASRPLRQPVPEPAQDDDEASTQQLAPIHDDIDGGVDGGVEEVDEPAEGTVLTTEIEDNPPDLVIAHADPVVSLPPPTPMTFDAADIVDDGPVEGAADGDDVEETAEADGPGGGLGSETVSNLLEVADEGSDADAAIVADTSGEYRFEIDDASGARPAWTTEAAEEDEDDDALGAEVAASITSLLEAIDDDAEDGAVVVGDVEVADSYDDPDLRADEVDLGPPPEVTAIQMVDDTAYEVPRYVPQDRPAADVMGLYEALRASALDECGATDVQLCTRSGRVVASTIRDEERRATVAAFASQAIRFATTDADGTRYATLDAGDLHVVVAGADERRVIAALFDHRPEVGKVLKQWGPLLRGSGD